MALPIYTHIPNLKVLTKIFFKLSRPKANLCGGGGGVTVLNPKRKFENFKCSFYKLQAYHVGLIAVLGWLQATSLQLAVASGCHLVVHSDIRLLFLVAMLNHTPSAVIQRGGRVGLVAYKSYI